jgi:hypothetical protein
VPQPDNACFEADKCASADYLLLELKALAFSVPPNRVWMSGVDDCGLIVGIFCMERVVVVTDIRPGLVLHASD